MGADGRLAHVMVVGVMDLTRRRDGAGCLANEHGEDAVAGRVWDLALPIVMALMLVELLLGVMGSSARDRVAEETPVDRDLLLMVVSETKKMGHLAIFGVATSLPTFWTAPISRLEPHR
ncbi:hypothetical protein ACLOJK_036443 [Asimina triloba]